MGGKAGDLEAKVQRIVEGAPCRMGVSIRIVGQGPILELNAREKFPLASVYKVPILATLFHKVSLGELSLDQRLVLREEDKTLSSDLGFLRPGLNPTLHDLCYLMIAHSDNTATDMVHRLIGLDAPNAYMKSLGLDSIDIYFPCREYFLMTLGYGGYGDISPKELVSRWRNLTRVEQAREIDTIYRQNRTVTADIMRRKGQDLLGLSEEKEDEDSRRMDEAFDNHGSPSDIAQLLELIATDRIVPGQLTKQMLEYMFNCDSRSRLPASIPPEVLVANKTGTVSGVVNDSAIIFASPGRIITCACLTSEVHYEDKSKVERAISDIGLQAFRARL